MRTRTRNANSSLLNHIEAESAQTTDLRADLFKGDPLAHLFKGIQFRDGGKEEAIRRVHELIDERLTIERKIGAAGHAAELKHRDVLLQQHREKIERLENAIHDIQRDHGKHLVHAITRQVYAYEESQDEQRTGSELGKAVQG